MPNSPLIVVLGDPTWSIKAMHLACAMARDSESVVFIIKMVRVNNPLLLGDPAGYVNYSAADRHALQDCEAIAVTYSVPVRQHVCPYADFVAALAGLTTQFDAAVLFASHGNSRFTIWNRYQHWRMVHAVGRPVYGLNTTADQPIVSLAPAGASGQSGVELPSLFPSNS